MICLFQERLDKIANPPPGEIPETFDEDFYEDQKDPMRRTQVIELNKVTKDFKYQEMALEKRLANQISRKQSAYGQSSMEESFPQCTDSGVTLEEEPSSQSSHSSTEEVRVQRRTSDEVSFSIETRARKQQELGGTCKQFVSKASQSTESLLLDEIEKFPSISTRMHSKGRACNPAYLQAGLLMMAMCNESPNQAVMNMYIMDTVVYKQKRQLPLRLRKDYQRQLHFLKKYTKAAERGETLLSRIAPDHTLDGASTDDDMEDDSINIGSDQENELEAWANDVVDEAVLKPMDADGGMYNLYSNSLLRSVVSLFQAKIVTRK